MPRLGNIPTDSPDGERCAGMLLYREIRRKRANLPILIFTANQDPAPRQIIDADRHARYIGRWSSPSFSEFISIVLEMAGAQASTGRLRPFIVHGQDEKTKLELKNLLQNTLGMDEPIILHEQPNLGRTLIEKFEDLATTADLAFVLLTPDDKLASPGDLEADKRRARQNVILELGFFLSMMGRHSGRVFLLYKGALDVPSDLSGIVYIDISAGLAAATEEIRRELAAIDH